MRKTMGTKQKAFSRIGIATIHILGLGCLSGAVFLQILVFMYIYSHGYFRTTEPNPIIFMCEIALTGFAVVYFIYVFRNQLDKLMEKWKNEGK